MTTALTVVVAAFGGHGAAFADDLPPGGSFVDDDGNVHEGYIEALADEAITRGCGDARFCPGDPVTRGHMAAFLRRALNLPSASRDHFVDDDGSTFEADINALAEAGITRGCGDSGRMYCPDGLVTRGQMAAFISRAGHLPRSSTNHFRDDEGSTFEANINALADAGVTVGCNPPDNTRFCPDELTRRDQMATFLGRFLDLDPRRPPTRDPATMPVLDAIEVWFPENRGDAVRVADCESSLNPRAVNPNGYHGLFQIGSAYHRSSFERVTGQRWDDGIYVAYYNAQYARFLYEDRGWSPWACRP